MGDIKLSDLTYRNLFSYQVMVVSLFLEYLPKVIASLFDFSTLERLPDVYITDDLRERRNDVVWRVSMVNGSIVYLAVLLEFQSRPDRLMALRIRSYSSLLLLDIAKRKRPIKKHSLPYVFPIVMYNGKRPWRVPLDADPLFVSMPDELNQYCPRQSYFLLDERNMPDEELSERNGLVTQLIKLERATKPEQVLPVLMRLEELLPEPENASLHRMFTLWAENRLKRAGFVEAGRTFRNLREVNNMLQVNAANWKKDYIREGEEIGEKRGETKGMVKLLMAMLEKRFGTLPKSLTNYIESTSDSDALMSFAVFAGQATSLQVITDRINGKYALS